MNLCVHLFFIFISASHEAEIIYIKKIISNHFETGQRSFLILIAFSVVLNVIFVLNQSLMIFLFYFCYPL